MSLGLKITQHLTKYNAKKVLGVIFRYLDHSEPSSQKLAVRNLWKPSKSLYIQEKVRIVRPPTVKALLFLNKQHMHERFKGPLLGKGWSTHFK